MYTKQLFEIFEQAGYELFYVGGFVRDLLQARALGEEESFWDQVNNGKIDIDLTTPARPEQITAILNVAGLPVIPIGIEYGTVQTILDDKKVEITTYRSDIYSNNSRHPEVVFGNDLKTDLKRRDFTINAMAMDGELNLIDPWQGARDLEKRIIQTVEGPQISFSDDPLRMLRACRFVARGFGHIESLTGQVLSETKYHIKSISAERVFQEMTKLLMSNQASAGINAMQHFGLLRVLFPELQALHAFTKPQGKYHHLLVYEHTLEVLDSSMLVPEVRWAALFHDVAKPATWKHENGKVSFHGHDELGAEMWNHVALRLKTSNEFRECVKQLIDEHLTLRGEMSKKAVRRLMFRLGDRLDYLFALRTADALGHKPEFVEHSLSQLRAIRVQVEEIKKEEKEVTNKLPRGTGNLLMQELGVKPGPELGAIMNQLKQMVIDGKLSPDSDLVKAAKELTK